MALLSWLLIEHDHRLVDFGESRNWFYRSIHAAVWHLGWKIRWEIFFGVLVNIRIGLDDPALTIGEWISKNKHTCELNYAINIGWAEIALLNPSRVWGARGTEWNSMCFQFGGIWSLGVRTILDSTLKLVLIHWTSLPSRLDSMGNELLGWSRARKKHTAAPCHTRV